MLEQVLKEQGDIGVDLIKQAVAKYSATNKTAESIEAVNNEKRLQILGRSFIEAMETGRGPRKSSTDGGFKDSMLEWMKARGIGSDLTEKKREQLAKFLVLRINRDGDKLYKAGGNRDVYSSVVEKIIGDLVVAVEKDWVEDKKESVFDSLNGIN